MLSNNKFYYRFFKYGLLGAGLFMWLVTAVSYFFPEMVSVNGSATGLGIVGSVSCVSIGLILIISFFLIKNNFAEIELGNQVIRIKHNSVVVEGTWLEVETLSQIQFVFPPLYRLKIKNYDKVVWFNTEPEFVGVNGFNVDTSEMGYLIQKKQKELSL